MLCIHSIFCLTRSRLASSSANSYNSAVIHHNQMKSKCHLHSINGDMLHINSLLKIFAENHVWSMAIISPLASELSSFVHSTSKSTQLQVWQLSEKSKHVDSYFGNQNQRFTNHTCLQKQSAKSVIISGSLHKLEVEVHRLRGNLEQWSDPGRSPWTPPTVSPPLVKKAIEKKQPHTPNQEMSRHWCSLREWIEGGDGGGEGDVLTPSTSSTRVK